MDINVEKVFARLRSIIVELLGPDVAELIGVEPGSSFVSDLEMDSIQIVAFVERATEAYGERADIYRWLSKLPIWRLKKVTIGEVASFIAAGSAAEAA